MNRRRIIREGAETANVVRESSCGPSDTRKAGSSWRFSSAVSPVRRVPTFPHFRQPAVAEVVGEFGGDGQGQARFADPARSRQRQQRDGVIQEKRARSGPLRLPTVSRVRGSGRELDTSIEPGAAMGDAPAVPETIDIGSVPDWGAAIYPET